MAAAWIFYALVTSALFAVAGWAGERLLAAAGRSRRWAWVASVAGAVAGAPLLVVGFQAAARFRQPFTDAAPVAASGPASGGGLPMTDALRIEGGEAAVDWLATVDPWLLAAWIACSVLYGLRLAGQWLSLHRKSKPWRQEEGLEIRTLPDGGPAAMGWSEALILVPRWFFELEDRDRATILEHEREHVRAGDHRLLMAAAVLLGFAPWNPLLRWSVRRLRDAVELDCDHRLVGDGVDRAGYAQLLLESQRRMAGPSLPFAVSTSGSCIGRRIRSLLGRETPPVKRTFALGGPLVVACLAGAALTAQHLQASGLLAAGLWPGSDESETPALACRTVTDAGHRTDVSLRLHRTSDSERAVVLVQEDPTLESGAEGLTGVVRAASGSPCEITGKALQFEVSPSSSDGTVHLNVSPDARVGVLDERTGHTAAIHTPNEGEPPVLCTFGPGDHFACRASDG